MGDYDYKLESQFNMAMAYLMRIDKLLYFCQRHAVKEELMEWAKYLRAVYREASVRLGPNEIIDILGNPKEKIDFKKLTDDVIEDHECNFKNIYFLLNNPVYQKRFKTRIMFLLDNLEVKLRRMLQQKGMLLPSKRDPTKAILDM